MKTVRPAAWFILLAFGLAALLCGWLRPDYATQFRESAGAPASWRFPLGTDSLGRDLLSRLLHGCRISVLLATAAALLTTILAGVVGGIAGYVGGRCDRLIVRAIDLMLALPWLFLLITVRALLPLDVTPATSLTITFGLLGLLGWPAAARVVRAGVQGLNQSGFVLQARACGCGRLRVLFRHIMPHLAPVLLAQFWTAIPAFLLSEANLGLLGLGLAEPLPSWGSLLREMESRLVLEPAAVAPLFLIVLFISAFKIILSKGDVRS